MDLATNIEPIHKDTVAWYVMRDLKRPNASDPAYKVLERHGFEVYTPMEWRVVKFLDKQERREMPVIPDLLFVHSTREHINEWEECIPTLQYRYIRGGYKKAMTVPDKDMDRFIKAATTLDNPRYYTVDEITPAMFGRKVRLIGGPLDGAEVPLLKMQGSKRKRIIVDIPMLLAVSVEVQPDYIQLI